MCIFGIERMEVREYLGDPTLQLELEQQVSKRNPLQKRFKNRMQKGKEDLTRDRLFVDLKVHYLGEGDQGGFVSGFRYFNVECPLTEPP